MSIQQNLRNRLTRVPYATRGGTDDTTTTRIDGGRSHCSDGGPGGRTRRRDGAQARTAPEAAVTSREGSRERPLSLDGQWV